MLKKTEFLAHSTFLFLFVLFVFNASPALSVKITMKDQSGSTLTKPNIKLQNTGTDTLKNFYFYYYFTVENNNPPVLQIDYAPKCNFRIDSLGNQNYRLQCRVAIDSGVVLPQAYFPPNAPDGAQFELHYNNWSSWDTSNDYSHLITGSNFVENNKITVHLMANDSLIYGVPPPYAAKPVAKFSASPTFGYDSLSVTFIDSSTGGIASRRWNFGDGFTDTAKNPVHTYKTVDTFSVKLVLSGIGGKDSLIKADYIKVAAGKPKAKFSGSPVTGVDTLTVRFKDSSTGNIVSRLWIFGDSATDTAKNPIHIYLSRGTYTVQLIATGPGGSDTAAKLNFILVTAPKTKAAFGASEVNGIETLTVHFYDSSTGSISSRLWNFGDNTTDTAKNPIHYYDSIGTFSVKLLVTDSGGGADSLIKAGFITIYSGIPKVGFSVSPTSGSDSLDAQFYDSSVGAVTGRLWNFGDGTTSTEKNPLHHYAKIDTYSVTLTVTGPGGKDSLTMPDLIKISPTQAHANFFASPDSGAKPLSVQFIDSSSGTISERWWNFGDSSTSTEKNPLHRYTATGAYTVILAVAGLGGVDTMKKIGSILVVDTFPPVNNLHISGRYLNGDSIEVALDSTSGIDTATAELVGIWYGFSDSVNFQDLVATKWFPADTVINKSTDGRFTIVLTNNQIGQTIRTIYCSVALKGVNGKLSQHRDTAFITEGAGIVNPIALASSAVSYSSIQLSWNKATGFDSLRLWYGLSPVPLSTASPGVGFDRAALPLNDTTFIITGLTSQTTYYFGAQVYGNGGWSYITDKASAHTTTLKDPDTTRIVNNITLTKKVFDPSTNSITVFWTMDSTKNQDFLTVSYSIGISVSFVGYPLDTFVSKQIITPVRRLSDSAVVNISETIVFDTVGYLSLWLRKNTGPWSFPTVVSRDTLRTPPLSWQKVTYFNNSRDTVYAFNNLVRLCNDIFIPPTPDTLHYWTPADSLLDGFIPVSIGFNFQKRMLSPAFFIGLKCNALPQGRFIEDARIFRFDNGEWSIEKDFGVDSASGYIWVKTQNTFYAPFIAMIDTVSPVCTVESHPEIPVQAGKSVTDTFIVRDNIVNMKCTFQYAKGGNAFESINRIDTVLSARVDTLILSTPDALASEDNGLRALFIVSDGTNSDTAIVSRRVIREQLSDVINTEAMKWLPLRMTAVPDSQDAKNALRAFAAKGLWEYDPASFRLFRWHAYEGNAQKPDKWVEYTDSLKNIFQFSPGNLLWIKTKKTTLLEFGRAITPSLIDNYPIVLQPKNWTDIALPFKFDIVLGDILDASNDGSGHVDSLQFYHWDFDSANHYITKPVYVPGLANVMADASLADRSSTMLSKDKTGYSIYNPLDQPCSLMVPPIPSSLSTSAAKLTKKSTRGRSQGWSVKITGRTKENEPLSPVFCGYIPGETGVTLFPAPPSFCPAAIGVCDDQKRFFGHAIVRGSLVSEGGVTFTLAFRNTSGCSQTIEYVMGNGDQVPDGMLAKILNPETGALDPAEYVHPVGIPPADCVYRHLVIGPKEYLAKMQQSLKTWRLDLIGAFPNPFGKIVRIRYTLPKNGIRHINVSIINCAGRIEYKKTLSCQNESGPREMRWDGRNNQHQKVASGIYVVRLTAMSDNGGIVGAFEKKLTYLP